MATTPHQHLPLQERVPVNNTLQRIIDTLILCLLLSFLAYRLTSIGTHSTVWLLAFVGECWFAFVWVLFMNAKWNPVIYKTYPERLDKTFDDLPAIDLLVTAADPKLEPPIITINTVLSLMAADYPAHKLACYVSDDGCSPVTYYSLTEAAKFAKLWVPFCKRYNVGVRAPFVYFSSHPDNVKPLSSDDQFTSEWEYMKNEYGDLSRRIEEAGNKSCVPYEVDDFSNVERGNHGSILKVVWENKETRDGIPHVVYVAREKRPKHPHHYKAGAMNILTRVSGIMTNAPFMLNVDCDMFANNPKVLLHGMCLLLGFEKEEFSGFVQAPQEFYGSLKDDPFGNQLVVFQRKVGVGIGGIQGPSYVGTGCFHRRKVIYGSPPMQGEINEHDGNGDRSTYKEIQQRFGNLKEVIDSARHIIYEKNDEFPPINDLSSRVEAAKKASSCTYEFNTCWGKEIGWVYGSTAEDILTGLKIHSMGWRSVYLILEPSGFLGCAPIGGPASLTQYKRWATGQLEVLFGHNSPLVATFTRRLWFRQCLAYLVMNIWGLRSIVELSYAMLPAYCLLANTSFLPKASEPAIIVPTVLFILFHISTLAEYLDCGLSVRAWWNNQRMQRISSLSALLFGLLCVVLKILGLSETVFEVTRKDQNSSDDGSDGKFTFDSSPMFVPGTAVVLLHLTALVAALLRMVRRGSVPGLGELVCSMWLLLCFWPFVRGLFQKGNYGIPWSVVSKAAVIVPFFLHLYK